MSDKITLTEKENEYLAKGIAVGVGIGVLGGLIAGYVELGFAIGGVSGVIGSLGYSLYMRHKENLKLKI
ncbi:hypothetical protein [Clostridium fallax]|uniref:Uncharacterized protein n=1 Tax=Clostridium fallax TaxID=1533 RepID=A0A1M4ZEY1_9CLOT|nr:hypothetical protein [Clostridium fallax]SHF16619.1 hypothetical protein SAMN05443638_1454 [Clostridium fallax]SQB22195.1 Uncharacterised protein [Clostridium fallax]